MPNIYFDYKDALKIKVQHSKTTQNLSISLPISMFIQLPKPQNANLTDPLLLRITSVLQLAT